MLDAVDDSLLVSCHNLQIPASPLLPPIDASPDLNDDELEYFDSISDLDESAKLREVVTLLRRLKMTSTGFLTNLLQSSEPDLIRYSNQFYAERSKRLFELLDLVWSHKKGQIRLTKWMMQGPARKVVCDDIAAGMESAKKGMIMGSGEVSLDYLETWSMNDIVDEFKAPESWNQVLDVATKGPTADKNKKKSTMLVRPKPITAAVLHIRSHNAQRLQLGLGLFTWATIASQHLLEVLNRCNLTPSYTTTLKVMKDIGVDSVLSAREMVSTKPHVYTYDNYNVSHSTHVKQHPGGPTKVQSSTFPVVYELYNGRFEDMVLQPILSNLSQSTPLTLTDISPTNDQISSYHFQARIHVIRALTTHQEGFESLKDDPLLQHKPRRPLPADHHTKYYPLRISQIEEASTKGNLMRARRGDINPYEQRQTFQLGMGPCHLILNLIWGINKKYAGSIRQIGSLKYYFSLLDKVRLGNEKPDYHALLATMQQILDGLLLHMWHLECGHSSLNKFTKSKPTADELHRSACRILKVYATPIDEPMISRRRRKRQLPNKGHHDVLNQNIRLLTRELLYVVEIIRAVSDGDFGGVEDTYPDQWGRGRSFNHSNEVLHWIHNVKKVWTPRFRFVLWS
ncbi:hypothetical protein C8J56DRAFT_785093 [Mycena floridula]|nr:hypothetical protein C8J56DRAFT_785093 [Mycena floridula]